MSPTRPSPREIVASVLEAWAADTPDAAVAQQLVTQGLSEAEASGAIELVRSGIMRAALVSAGLPADQISSDVDDDPIFRAAVEAGRRNIAGAPPEQPPDAIALGLNLTSDDVEARRTAAYELGQSRDPQAAARLLAALDDADLYVKTYAIQSLATLKAKDAVAPCCALLRSDAPPLVLVNAIKALATIGDPAAVPALIEATRHENAFVRHDAAWALGEFADPRAIPALEALLADTTIPVERDESGLTSQTSIYSVSDHAQRSLAKIRTAGSSTSRSARHDLALSLAWTSAGALVLAITLYAYFQHDVFSKLGLTCGSLALVVGLLGLFRPATNK